MSSSVTRIRRPLPSPSNGIDVRAGQAITMLSPSPRWFLLDALLEPLAEGEEQRDRDRAPDDAEERQERPQLLVADVLQHLAEEGEGGHGGPRMRGSARGATRSSWAAARRRGPSRLRPSATSTLMPSERPILISFLTGGVLLGLAPGSSTRGLAVLERDEPLGQQQDVLLLADDDVGVGRVAGAQDDALGRAAARSRRRRASRPSAVFDLGAIL